MRKPTASGSPRSRKPIWIVEPFGLEPVPDSDRYGGPHRLFWVWFAANLSFAYLVIGALVWSYGLSLWQSVIAILAGVAAFVVIGYLGLPGRVTGLPTMVYSSRYFGRAGNRLMALMSWVNLLGWETVVLIIAAYAVATILHLAVGTPYTALWYSVSLALSAFLELSIAFFGHAVLESFQALVSYVFGFLTLGVLAAFLPHVDWQAVLGRPAGPWVSGVIPAVTIVIAVSALSWVTTAADYTRHLPRQVSNGSIVRAATFGAIAATALLMLVGVLLGQSAPNLATAVNPIQLLMHWIPAWAAIPYLFVTAIGIIAGGSMCAYSSGLSLLAAGVRTRRSRTIFIDAAVSLGASLYVLLVSQHFLTSFEAFLSLIACLLAPWTAIALQNIGRVRSLPSAWTLASWGVGAIISLLTTQTAIFTGPLTFGIFRTSSLGYVLGFAVSLVLYQGAIRMAQSRGKPADSATR